jgi:DNA-binding LytR/AlgR family response regulator
MKATALIAEDEPLLAAGLQAELAALWPELTIGARVGDGEAAVAQSLALRPDVLFLDIRMPGMTGLEAAQALAEDWPDEGKPFPLIVFITAYDKYAVEAFERAAVDYLIKPVQTERLAQSCARLQELLRRRAQPQAADAGLSAMAEQLRGMLGTGPAAPTAAPLRVIQAAVGNTIAMVPVDDVLYFEAADKYLRVVTAEREYLIRTPLRELEPQLDANRFWKIHRGTIVRCDAIAGVVRNEAGKLMLNLKGHPDKLAVSRLYAHLFKPM